MKSNRLELVEEIVLSVALSYGLDGLVGLFLGLSPIAITLDSIAVSVSAIVLVFALLAFIRKMRDTSGFNVQIPEQVSA